MTIGSDNMKTIHTVVLAAGASRRLGFNKLTVKVDGEAIVRRAVIPFVEVSLGEVIVVTGSDMPDVAEALEGLPVRIVYNRDRIKGMSSSIRAALPFIAGAKAVFIHLGDKPFIKKEMLHVMVDRLGFGGKRIVVPVFGGLKGHPVLIDMAPYEADMEGLTGDRGLREVIEKHGSDVLFIEGDEDVLFDIDTLEDIDILRERGYKVEKGEG